jgi:hypothetical protein
MIVKDSFRKSASVEISGADEQNCFGHLLAYFEIGRNATRAARPPSSYDSSFDSERSWRLRNKLAAPGRAGRAVSPRPDRGYSCALLGQEPLLQTIVLRYRGDGFAGD